MQTISVTPGLWSREVAAAWLSVHPKTLDRLRCRDKGLAACVRKIGKRVLYSAPEMAKWLELQSKVAQAKRR